jgi:hypothetical protein
MVSVDEIERPPEALFLLNKKVMQVGPVYSKVPQMNDAGNIPARGAFSIFDLLVDRIKVAMGVTDNQYHYAPPNCPVKS